MTGRWILTHIIQQAHFMQELEIHPIMILKAIKKADWMKTAFKPITQNSKTNSFI